ncbi:tyrosine-type recombinase/integrase [Endozoicomonas sp. Mp262]|uniref:tyrosine-type recombinase/integrase n=1 Tax=Endozoicomonas sp. Mp262 TaxID=2919499 RepID=UPI0021D9321A
MPKIKLFDTTIRNAKPKEKEYVLTDTDGLICRIFPSGRKCFCWRYIDKFNDGKQSRIEYGDYPHRSLADAKRIHLEARTARKNNLDIRSPEVFTKIIYKITGESVNPDPAAQEGIYLFSNLVSTYFTEYVDKEGVSPRPYNRIKNYVLPILKDYAADDIPHEIIETMVVAMRKVKSEQTVNDTVRFTATMYRWGKKNFLVKTNPFADLGLKRIKNVRKTYYSMHELKTLLLNKDSYQVAGDVLLIQKALIFSGCRRSEVIKAEKKEFNFNTGIWTIPASRLKNQDNRKKAQFLEDFKIPMSSQLQQVFKEAIEKHSNKTHVFGSKTTVYLNGKWIKNPQGASSVRNYDNYITAYRNHYGIMNKINHDLRRTLETHLTNIGVAEYITTAMTGHSREGMSRVYNQAKQIHVMRAAFQMWGDFIEYLCSVPDIHAMKFDEQVPGEELKKIYRQFNFNNYLMDALEIFEG